MWLQVHYVCEQMHMQALINQLLSNVLSLTPVLQYLLINILFIKSNAHIVVKYMYA